VSAEEIGPVDAVLLSHDQHPDNLDSLGRELLGRVPLVLTTASGAGRLGGAARALPSWEDVGLRRPDGGALRVTGVPALHGPPGSEAAVGEVTGFVLAGEGLPTVYVSGDNASLEVVREIARRVAPVDVAVLFAGAAKTPLLGDALLTLDGRLAAEAAAALGARRVVPLHVDGWRHYSEDATAVRDAFARAGLGDRLVLLAPGETATV
jgi:L-ascorbate metabolism protein UlaG (beta-lactamase superfamily)